MPRLLVFLSMGVMAFVSYPYVYDLMHYLFGCPVDAVGLKGGDVLGFKILSAGVSYVLAFVVFVFVRWVASIPATKEQ